MKCFLSIIIGVLLLEISSGDNATPPTITALDDGSSDTLIFAHVIFRHGARNIEKTYPTSKYKDESFWPGGFGQLTKEGKAQLYDLGLYLRRRYNNLLGTKYSPNKVYIQSTDVDRTLMSAEAALSGLFIPTEEEIWNKGILWQPIPVHTIPRPLDHVLSGGRPCPKYKALYADYMKQSEEVQRIYTEYADLFPYLSRMSGLNITTITDVYWLYNTLEIERDTNKTLPEWAQKAINGPMEYIAQFDYKTYADTPELARLKSGFLLKEMFEHISQKVSGTLKPNRSLWLYSGHDLTILNMLNSLGLFELHISPYAATLHLELYKSVHDEYYVQLFYRKLKEEHPIPMKIPQCGEKCPLSQFHAIYNNIIPGDFESECRLF